MASTNLGMNLTGVSYWSTEYPFIDRFKTSGSWAAQDSNWKPMASEQIKLDANGYPTGMPSGAINMYTNVNMDPASYATTDRYVLTYSGDAKVFLSSSKIISSEPGKIVFEYQSESNMMQLSINATSSGSSIKDIHIVREDQVALFEKGEIFNPAFLARTDDWTTIRTMDWSHTNNSQIVSWSDRTTLSSASWSDVLSDKSSVPLEVLVALANKTHTDMWLNIPAMANDDYVRKTLEYVRDSLDPTLKINLEYSNEVWNWVFSQTSYARDMADKLWGKDTNGDGKNDQNTGEGGAQTYYGYRSAQVAAISQEVFGSAHETRVNNVLSTQTVYQGLENAILQGVAKANVGSVANLFESYGVTAYIGLMPTTAADNQLVLSWARSGADGLDKAFRELQFGGGLSFDASLAGGAKTYGYQANIAAKNGMALVAYEGGLGLDLAAFKGSELEEVKAFFAKMQADPRMATIMTKLVADFQSAGGTLLNLFNDAQAITGSTGGVWGLTTSIYETSPGYETLKSLVGTAAQPVSVSAAAGATTPPTTSAATGVVADTKATVIATASAAVNTAAAVYHMTDKDASVTYTATSDFIAVGNGQSNTLTGGKGNDQLYGGAGDDTLIGNDGNDALNGQGGTDRMVGGAGNDNYTVDSGSDVVVEAANGGRDTIWTSISYTLPDNVEDLRLSGDGGATATGNALNNWLTGTAGADRFSGLDGADTVNAGSGNDELLGGAGNDQLFGQDGDDTIDGGAGNDLIAAGAGADVIRGGGGQDILMGDAGADRFVFGPGDLGKTSATTAQIYGFSRSEGDKIDLSAYDAKANTPLNDAFAYIGAANFSGQAGQLRATLLGGNWTVQGDMNGDKVADFVLNVQSNSPLSATDFVL